MRSSPSQVSQCHAHLFSTMLLHICMASLRATIKVLHLLATSAFGLAPHIIFCMILFLSCCYLQASHERAWIPTATQCLGLSLYMGCQAHLSTPTNIQTFYNGFTSPLSLLIFCRRSRNAKHTSIITTANTNMYSLLLLVSIKKLVSKCVYIFVDKMIFSRIIWVRSDCRALFFLEGSIINKMNHRNNAHPPQKHIPLTTSNM